MDRIRTMAVLSLAAACAAAPGADVPRTVRSIEWSALQRQGKLLEVVLTAHPPGRFSGCLDRGKQ